MAKAMSKTALVRHLAEQNEMTRAQVSQFMEVLAQTAYSQAKNGFTIPGLGKLVLVQRKARWGRNPATGEKIRIQAKKVVKFRVAKACKDAILGPAATSKKKKAKKR
ncbi:MAG: HU family DNA-binding protein [Phycisphaerae bacterium]|nr:HU family DNA-binding protein [Phycisphaerae bacterium]